MHHVTLAWTLPNAPRRAVQIVERNVKCTTTSSSFSKSLNILRDQKRLQKRIAWAFGTSSICMVDRHLSLCQTFGRIIKWIISTSYRDLLMSPRNFTQRTQGNIRWRGELEHEEERLATSEAIMQSKRSNGSTVVGHEYPSRQLWRRFGKTELVASLSVFKD